MLRAPWRVRYTVSIINIIQVAVSPADQKTATIKMTACGTHSSRERRPLPPPTGCLCVILIKSYA